MSNCNNCNSNLTPDDLSSGVCPECGAETAGQPHRIVASATFSGDRKRIVTAGFDNTARVWNVDTGKSLRHLVGHTGSVNSTVFSPDAEGRLILTAGSDGDARIWDSRSGRSLTRLTGHKGPVLQAAFSNDGKFIVTSEDKTAAVWPAGTDVEHRDTPLRTLRVGASVLCAAFSADGSRIVTGSDGYTVKLWDTQDADTTEFAREILSLTGHTREVTSVTFSPDGRHALTASRDGRAILWLTTDWHDPERGVAAR